MLVHGTFGNMFDNWQFTSPAIPTALDALAHRGPADPGYQPPCAAL